MNSPEVDTAFWNLVGGEFRLSKQSDRERRLALAYADKRLSSAAFLRSLLRSGIVIRPDIHHQMENDLADVSQQYGMTPDDMHALMVRHEPSLAFQIEQPLLWGPGLDTDEQ